MGQPQAATATITAVDQETSPIIVLDKGEVASISVSGTFTGTLQVQRKLPGQTAFQAVPDADGNHFTAADEKDYEAGARQEIKVRAASFTSGTANVRITTG